MTQHYDFLVTEVATINARYLLDLFWYCLEIAKYLDTSVLYWAWYWIWKIWVLILVLLLSLDFWGIDIDIGIPFQILRYWNWYWYWIQKHLVLVFSLKLSPGVLDVRLGGGNPQKRCPGENVSQSLNYYVLPPFLWSQKRQSHKFKFQSLGTVP